MEIDVDPLLIIGSVLVQIYAIRMSSYLLVDQTVPL
jgi:hypothetical protein